LQRVSTCCHWGEGRRGVTGSEKEQRRGILATVLVKV